MSALVNEASCRRPGVPDMIALRALGVAIGLVIIWQAIILVFAPPPFMLPAPLAVFAALRDRPGALAGACRHDADRDRHRPGRRRGCSAAVLALAMSFLPLTKRLLLPVMVVSQAIPVFAIAPLLALWFGFGLASKIVMATIAIFFPVASAFHDGLARTDPQLLDLARLYRAPHWRQVALLRIPAALPALITGLRLAAVYAPIGALIGEWVGASSGLGYAMLLANGRAQTDVVFAALILLAAMSVLLRAAVDLAHRATSRPGRRKPSS